MPTYQYACTECEHAFEQVQSFSDDALTVCPACSGRLRKVFNAVGVVFKGSGFYRTDSRTGKEKSAAARSEKGGPAGSDSSPSKDGSAAAKSDSGSTKSASSGSSSTGSGSSGSGSSGSGSSSGSAPAKAASSS